jgi:hypothetical protein
MLQFRFIISRFGLVSVLLMSVHAWSQDSPRIAFDSLSADSGSIMGTLHIDHLIDKQTMNGLRKGMTAIIEYRIQIWHEKSRWVKSPIHERVRRFKINYDHWENKYAVFDREGESQLFEEKDLVAYCQHLPRFKIGPLDILKPDHAYRLVAQIVIKPMSVENLEELKHWLSGEAGEFDTRDIQLKRSPLKKIGDWAMRALVNLTGFGDRIIEGRSPLFTVMNESLLLKKGN